MEVILQLRAPVALPPGKEHWGPLNRRMNGHHSHPGRFRRQGIFLTPGGNRKHGPSIAQPLPTSMKFDPNPFTIFYCDIFHLLQPHETLSFVL
jgi:hypothetical protein